MTNRGERRLFWLLIFCGGVVIAALPALVPEMRYAVLDLAAGAAMMAVSDFRLWRKRRRSRREPWHPET
jgi:hypothetical protein